MAISPSSLAGRSGWVVFLVSTALAGLDGAGLRSQAASPVPQTQQSRQSPNTAAIVFGVGSPNLSADRSGTSIGIVAGGTLYLFDAGPGVERRIMEAGSKLAALQVERFGPVFITHIHRDHTAGLAALLAYHDMQGGTLSLSSAANAATSQPFTVYGPDAAEGNPSIGAMLDHLRAAFPLSPTLQVAVKANHIAPGVVYEDRSLKVTAFRVEHIPNSFGFRIETADRVIVISGDARPSDAVVQACNGCDLLFHEVYGLTDEPGNPTADYHTSATALAEIARRAHPKQLVIYHDVGAPQTETLGIIARSFTGKAKFAKDLDVF